MATQTQTSTHTFTHARHVAAKIAADLKRLQRIYRAGHLLSDIHILEYEDEATILLSERCLGTVTYGFKRNEEWLVALRYTASQGLLASDSPGGLVPSADISHAFFGSFLTYSQKWENLTSEQKGAIKNKLPFQRTGGREPSFMHSAPDKQYSSGDIGVRRSLIGRY